MRALIFGFLAAERAAGGERINGWLHRLGRDIQQVEEMEARELAAQQAARDGCLLVPVLRRRRAP
jgi:hypothetical protein